MPQPRQPIADKVINDILNISGQRSNDVHGSHNWLVCGRNFKLALAGLGPSGNDLGAACWLHPAWGFEWPFSLDYNRLQGFCWR